MDRVQHSPGPALRGLVGPGTAATYLHSPDTATLYEQAMAAGAQVLRPLADSDHGSRELTVREPLTLPSPRAPQRCPAPARGLRW